MEAEQWPLVPGREFSDHLLPRGEYPTLRAVLGKAGGQVPVIPGKDILVDRSARRGAYVQAFEVVEMAEFSSQMPTSLAAWVNV